jgi:hypothetical protein
MGMAFSSIDQAHRVLVHHHSHAAQSSQWAPLQSPTFVDGGDKLELLTPFLSQHLPGY